jgi:ankyrin repeat protein
MIAILLRHPSVNANSLGKYGRNALHYLAESGRATNSLANLLLKAGTDPWKADVDGRLLIHLAARSGNTEVMKALRCPPIESRDVYLRLRYRAKTTWKHKLMTGRRLCILHTLSPRPCCGS